MEKFLDECKGDETSHPSYGYLWHWWVSEVVSAKMWFKSQDALVAYILPSFSCFSLFFFLCFIYLFTIPQLIFYVIIWYSWILIIQALIFITRHHCHCYSIFKGSLFWFHFILFLKTTAGLTNRRPHILIPVPRWLSTNIKGPWASERSHSVGCFRIMICTYVHLKQVYIYFFTVCNFPRTKLRVETREVSYYVNPVLHFYICQHKHHRDRLLWPGGGAMVHKRRQRLGESIESVSIIK
jgi:hypothetical protein